MTTLFPLNYWYTSRPNEIFLDLDNKRSVSRAFNVLSFALRRADLQIKNVFVYPSTTKGHVHMIVVLREERDLIERLAWSLWMANDRLRVAFVLERWLLDIDRADLLVGDRKYHREPDDMCHCKGKHKHKRVTGKCDAMARLIGAEAATADYFTRTGRVKHKPVESALVPWGKVSKTMLRKWGENNGKRLL